jgi:hypothetical protein
MIATRLTPNPSILPALNAIARACFYAEGGRFSNLDLLASRIVFYATALNRLGLDCECTWRNLSEGLYPIDATQENLDRVAQDAPDLSTIVDWPTKSVRYSRDPAIFLVAENSD